GSSGLNSPGFRFLSLTPLMLVLLSLTTGYPTFSSILRTCLFLPSCRDISIHELFSDRWGILLTFDGAVLPSCRLTPVRSFSRALSSMIPLTFARYVLYTFLDGCRTACEKSPSFVISRS